MTRKGQSLSFADVCISQFKTHVVIYKDRKNEVLNWNLVELLTLLQNSWRLYPQVSHKNTTNEGRMQFTRSLPPEQRSKLDNFLRDTIQKWLSKAFIKSMYMISAWARVSTAGLMKQKSCQVGNCREPTPKAMLVGS